jgi:hypothetical protein
MKSSVKLSRSERSKSELFYVRDAYRRLKRQGVSVAWEAALFGRSIDLAYKYEEDLVAVEFKLKDWRRALQQAQHHKIGADYVYICLPYVRHTERLIEAAKHAQVGILSFIDNGDWPFTILYSSPKSGEIWNVAREKILNQLKVGG